MVDELEDGWTDDDADNNSNLDVIKSRSDNDGAEASRY